MNLFNASKDYEPFTISGTGKQVRDVLHSDDLVELYKLAYLKKDEVNGQIFNIGGGIKNSLSILDLLIKLQDILKFKEFKYINIERRTSDQDFFVADISKAKKIIKWEPKVNLEDGLNQMINWVNSNLNSH